jgi:hypothetical protein
MPPLRCLDCNDLVDPQRVGIYRQVIGWEKVRTGGGANAIVLRKETGDLLCGGCGERRKLHDRMGIQPGQETLI